MQDTNIFEYTSRFGLRFKTSRGMVDSTDLWSMPLTSRDGFDLDSVGQAIIKQLQAHEVTSLVKSPTLNAAVAVEVRDNKVRLEVVKRIIHVRESEAEAAMAQARAHEEIRRLEGLLAKKAETALEGLTVEELEERIKALKAS